MTITRTILSAALAATLVPAAGACPLDGQMLVGYSANGQWLIAWDTTKAVGTFDNSERPVRWSQPYCLLVGKTLSAATLGTRAQAIRTAPDPAAAASAAWAQYVKVPLTDPSMAAVMRDFRAQACPRLPFRPRECE